MNDNSHKLNVFLEIHSDLPRQGPGDDASTLRALSTCRKLPEKPVVLDIGCGPGMQTLALANVLATKITAVDVNQKYLNQLRRRADETKLSKHIEIVSNDMQALDLRDLSFDLIWAEGSAYIMGFENALRCWKKLLKVRGYIAVTELVWLRNDPPGELVEFFEREYSAMTDIQTNLATIHSSGYEPIAHFTLPDAAWWENYYTPLESRLALMQRKFSGDSVAVEIIRTTKTEICMRRRYPEFYGYEFFIACAND